jgi:hypothetical protein
MKYLINANFVAIRKGEFVAADNKAAEFLLDSTDQTLKRAVLLEIAKANKIKLSTKLSVADSYELLDEELSKMNIPEQNQPTESQKVLELVKVGHAAGKTEDQILCEIIVAGISFKKAGKLYAQAVVDAGIAVNTKDLKTRAGEIMTTAEFKPSTHAEVETMAKTIKKEFPKAEDGQISSVIRRFLRAGNIEIPATPKGQRGATGFRKAAFDWMLANPTAEDSAFVAWAVKDKEKDEKVASRMVEVFTFVKKFAASQIPVAAGKVEKAKTA